MPLNTSQPATVPTAYHPGPYNPYLIPTMAANGSTNPFVAHAASHPALSAHSGPINSHIPSWQHVHGPVPYSGTMSQAPGYHQRTMPYPAMQSLPLHAHHPGYWHQPPIPQPPHAHAPSGSVQHITAIIGKYKDVKLK